MAEHTTPTPSRDAAEPESLEQLRGDCSQMDPRWKADARLTPAPVSLAHIQGVSVPATSAHLVDDMSEYGTADGRS